MSKLKVITLGDKTTTGGIVENGALTVYCHGKLVALIGSMVYCPQCKTTGIINKTRSFNVYAEGKLVCLENDVVECACPLGTNRVTASPDAFEFIGYENGSVGMSTASFATIQARTMGDTHPATAEFQAQRFS
ncbi:PAAR domain-containing protein [Siccibacter turicensis]|uniref:PAAR domain-containing protein n=1 Tax=Siccibacter turicensis TaxID=357233 RepID=UPI002A6AC9DF|nr:PAAR domain-containing protein [Siccibacter turicensis]MDY0969740.1 PAAR domain-containing protein [Siccibacter turicensis]